MSGLTWLLYTWLLWVVAGALIGAAAKGRAMLAPRWGCCSVRSGCL